MLARNVNNNDDITFFSVYQRFQSPRVIMCCSPYRFADWAAPHYHMYTRAWQTLIHRKECLVRLVFILFGFYFILVTTLENIQKSILVQVSLKQICYHNVDIRCTCRAIAANKIVHSLIPVPLLSNFRCKFFLCPITLNKLEWHIAFDLCMGDCVGYAFCV